MYASQHDDYLTVDNLTLNTTQPQIKVCHNIAAISLSSCRSLSTNKTGELKVHGITLCMKKQH